MPATRRRRDVDAPREEVWRTVGDPHHLPRWWPRVERVEGVGGAGFTEVLRTDKGVSVRADFRIEARREPELIAWAQDVDGTPFERVLKSATTSITLRPKGSGTEVEVRVDQQLRGVSRLGGFMLRRATARQLDEALAALERLHG